MKLIDFETEYPSYQKIPATKDSIRANIGKRMIYVDRVDPHRGYYRIESGVICAVRYSKVYFDDYNNEADIRHIKECGVKDMAPTPTNPS